jgi:N-acetylneuraminic acid mutarotase
MALVAADGKIHAIGGRITNPASRVADHDIYDPKTDRWTASAPLPTARSGLASALYRNLIVVLGGELPPDTFANNEAYDVKAAAWRTLAPMPHGRHGTGATVLGGSLYVAAGSLKPGSGEVTDQLIVFTMP